jgi:hypothetical protein
VAVEGFRVCGILQIWCFGSGPDLTACGKTPS